MSKRLLHAGQVSDDIKAPISMHSRAVKADLDKFFMALPTNLQQHSKSQRNIPNLSYFSMYSSTDYLTIVAIARRYYHSAEVFIYESSLHRSLFPMSLNSQRLDMLYACLTSAKALLDDILVLPSSSYYSMSHMTLAQVGHVLATAFKLCFVDVPGWDLAHVRSTVNILRYFDHLISQFRHVGALIDNSQQPPGKRSFPTGCALALGRVRGWYENRVAAEKEATQQEEQTGPTGMEDTFMGENFDYFDEAFMGDWQTFAGDFMQQ